MEIRETVMVCDYCHAESPEQSGEITTQEVAAPGGGYYEAEACARCWGKVTTQIAKRARYRRRRRRVAA